MRDPFGGLFFLRPFLSRLRHFLWEAGPLQFSRRADIEKKTRLHGPPAAPAALLLRARDGRSVKAVWAARHGWEKFRQFPSSRLGKRAVKPSSEPLTALPWPGIVETSKEISSAESQDGGDLPQEAPTSPPYLLAFAVYRQSKGSRKRPFLFCASAALSRRGCSLSMERPARRVYCSRENRRCKRASL